MPFEMQRSQEKSSPNLDSLSIYGFGHCKLSKTLSVISVCGKHTHAPVLETIMRSKANINNTNTNIKVFFFYLIGLSD